MSEQEPERLIVIRKRGRNIVWVKHFGHTVSGIFDFLRTNLKVLLICLFVGMLLAGKIDGNKLLDKLTDPIALITILVTG